MKIRFTSLLLVCSLLAVLPACTDDKAPADPPVPASAPANKPQQAAPIPKFEMDSAYAHVAKQLSFGPRVMNTPAHEAAGAWLGQQLRRYGARVEEQKFTATAYDNTPLKSTNYLGRFFPDRPDRVALYAHWDTRHVADSKLENDPDAVVNGADDGASGVGVLLEIARLLQTNDPGIGVDIVFLDAEDYGSSQNTNSWGLGAQHYATNLTGAKPRFGILLDMVGGENARFAVEQISNRYAPEVVRKVWQLASQMGYGKFFVVEDGGAVTDDHYFINTLAGIPTIDIINRRTETQSGFVEHWHTGNDNLEAIDKRSLRAAGQVVLAVLFREGAGTL